jgi:hypothetical protein
MQILDTGCYMMKLETGLSTAFYAKLKTCMLFVVKHTDSILAGKEKEESRS